MSKAQWLKENLRPGEHYAGIILGDRDYHLVLLPGEAEKKSLSWKQAMNWAASVGGELPTRREQSLLFVNLKKQLKRTWYWSVEQHVLYSEKAWNQYFDYGAQGYDDKSYKGCACAVRRIYLVEETT